MPKQSPENSEVQGALFQETIHTTGGTDPELQTRYATFEPVPEGVYSENTPAQPATTLQPEAAEALAKSVHEANKTTNRHRSQLGKHSALEDGGKYTDIQPGDYLPGFGPVTHSNFEDAMRHAEDLEANR